MLLYVRKNYVIPFDLCENGCDLILILRKKCDWIWYNIVLWESDEFEYPHNLTNKDRFNNTDDSNNEHIVRFLGEVLEPDYHSIMLTVYMWVRSTHGVL